MLPSQTKAILVALLASAGALSCCTHRISRSSSDKNSSSAQEMLEGCPSKKRERISLQQEPRSQACW